MSDDDTQELDRLRRENEVLRVQNGIHASNAEAFRCLIGFMKEKLATQEAERQKLFALLVRRAKPAAPKRKKAQRRRGGRGGG